MRKSDSIGLVLLAFVIGCRYSAPVADFYAERGYPIISAVLSRVASVCPVSLEEIVVIVGNAFNTRNKAVESLRPVNLIKLRTEDNEFTLFGSLC